MDATSACHEMTAVAVGPFVRAQILTRLREALAIARRNLGAELDRFRTLLSETLERVDGIALPLEAARDWRSPRASQLTAAVLSQTPGEPVSEFRLIPFGEITVERPVAGESFVFTRRHAESACRWFEQMGRKLAIDYEHQSFERFNTRPDGLRPAAGWIGGLEVRDDGLWAVDVTWTPRAAELLRNGEYRYFSPVIFWTDEDHTDVAALGPVALTNDPAMRGVQPLAARRAVDEAEGGRASELPADEALLAARQELEAARAEIARLRRQLQLQEAEAFVERGLRLGKIVDSTSMDWRADYLRDAEAAEERLARAPVLLPPGRTVALTARGEVAGLPAANRAAPAVLAGFGTPAIEPEDLAVFERAVAAGRVLGVRP